NRWQGFLSSIGGYAYAHPSGASLCHASGVAASNGVVCQYCSASAICQFWYQPHLGGRACGSDFSHDSSGFRTTLCSGFGSLCAGRHAFSSPFRCVLLLMAVLRLGFLANFLRYPVISGFVSASGLLIALSQMRHIFGVSVNGQSLLELAPALWGELGTIHWASFVIGMATIVFLQWMRKGL